MSKQIINSVDDFLNLKGKVLGNSSWITVSQDMINQFADTTLDYQWVHVDVEKAIKESPYQTTIAHGYLTLALLPHLLDDIVEVNNLKHLVNYGIDKMRYKNVVPAGSKIRLKATLDNAKDLGNVCKAFINCVFEIEGEETPALEGNIVFIYYFN